MIKFLNEASNRDVNEVGGKAAALGELIKAGIPVPEGFVITTKVSLNDIENVKKDIFKAFDKLSCKSVAVRSSGTREDSSTDSFAGQFETYLNIRKKDLLDNIKKCMNSVSSSRIKAYCEERGIDKNKIRMAVIIQKMLNSEVGGTAFTIHPVTKDETQILIEAGFGLGEAVVSGMITPDAYIVDKNSFKILNKNIGEQEKMLIIKDEGTKEVSLDSDKAVKQKLSDELIIEIAKTSKKVEDYFGKPVDIEWAVEKKKAYFLQARPITTL